MGIGKDCLHVHTDSKKKKKKGSNSICNVHVKFNDQILSCFQIFLKLHDL